MLTQDWILILRALILRALIPSNFDDSTSPPLQSRGSLFWLVSGYRFLQGMTPFEMWCVARFRFLSLLTCTYNKPGSWFITLYRGSYRTLRFCHENRDYFMENARVRFLFTRWVVSENERVSAAMCLFHQYWDFFQLIMTVNSDKTMKWVLFRHTFFKNSTSFQNF